MTLAHQSPIVDYIVFNMIREVHFEKFKFSNKQTIDTTIVPSFSENMMTTKGFQGSVVPRANLPPVSLPAFGKSNPIEPKKIEPPLKKQEPPKKIIDVDDAPPGYKKSILDLKEPEDSRKVSLNSETNLPPKLSQETTRIITKPLPRPPQLVPINIFQNPPNYGKLNMVMRDPSVQFIECPGPGQRIIVTKNGRKQQTNFTLSKEEIQMLLDNISNKTKIPLITGVFRVSWDNFIINSIVSDILEPRFLIKKER